MFFLDSKEIPLAAPEALDEVDEKSDDFRPEPELLDDVWGDTDGPHATHCQINHTRCVVEVLVVVTEHVT